MFRATPAQIGRAVGCVGMRYSCTLAFVVYVAGLSLRAFQRVAGMQDDVRTDADIGLDVPAQFVAQRLLLLLAEAGVLVLELDVHLDAVEISIAIQMYLVDF